MSERVTTQVVTRTRVRRALQRQAQKRLVEKFVELHPTVIIDEDARAATLAEVVLSSVGAAELGAAIHDVAHGDVRPSCHRSSAPADLVSVSRARDRFSDKD